MAVARVNQARGIKNVGKPSLSEVVVDIRSSVVVIIDKEIQVAVIIKIPPDRIAIGITGCVQAGCRGDIAKGHRDGAIDQKGHAAEQAQKKKPVRKPMTDSKKS